MDYNRIANELRQMNCIRHGNQAAIELDGESFKYSNVCCNEFQNRLNDAVAAGIETQMDEEFSRGASL